MKLIHCADLHLDSKLHTHLDRDRAKRRRDELLRNFERLAGYASRNGVEAVLIAGDLFDRDTVSALAKNTVLSVIKAHPHIRFYYLRGNHDTGDCLGMKEAGSGAAPSNLFLFGNRWKTYREGKRGRIAITGLELTRENSAGAPASLRTDPACFNIVMLHGQETGGRPASAEGLPSGTVYGRSFEQTFSEKDAKYDKGGGYAGVISIPALRGRNIDYLFPPCAAETSIILRSGISTPAKRRRWTAGEYIVIRDVWRDADLTRAVPTDLPCWRSMKRAEG